MLIAFIHPHKSFLPEIHAYCNFFSRHGIRTAIHRTHESSETQADVEWHFLGLQTNKKKKNTITIHEYASASLPPFGNKKDLIKRWFNTTPDYRLFLNEYVKNRLGFKDDIPFGFRDMGIDDSFFLPDKKNIKIYDFIYTGSVTQDRQIEKLLGLFAKENLKKHSLLVLSKDYGNLARQFSGVKNIQFQGPVAHEAVADYISKAKFAINYIPDREPLNQQTPVKLLEYLASKIPVISSKYEWVERFRQEYGGNFFYPENDGSNLTWENLTQYPFSFPDMNEWRWEKQIRKSGILEFLQSRFQGLDFK